MVGERCDHLVGETTMAICGLVEVNTIASYNGVQYTTVDDVLNLVNHMN